MEHKITPPDLVSISGKKIRVVAGLIADNPLYDNPREQKPRAPDELRIETLRGMTPVYVRWIVDGEGPYEVSVHSVKGGVATLSESKP